MESSLWGFVNVSKLCRPFWEIWLLLNEVQTWNNCGLYVESSKCRALSKYSIILSSLSSLFPCLEYFNLHHIPVVDVTHFVPLFSSVHKLVSLKVFGITIEGDEGGLPAVTIPPQHCPSLSVVDLAGRASSFLFQSLVLPNINTLTAMVSPG